MLSRHTGSVRSAVFQRGNDGKITGFIYLRGKNSIVFRRIV